MIRVLKFQARDIYVSCIIFFSFLSSYLTYKIVYKDNIEPKNLIGKIVIYFNSIFFGFLNFYWFMRILMKLFLLP
jgi:hypothetical protein